MESACCHLKMWKIANPTNDNCTIQAFHAFRLLFKLATPTTADVKLLLNGGLFVLPQPYDVIEKNINAYETDARSVMLDIAVKVESVAGRLAGRVWSSE